MMTIKMMMMMMMTTTQKGQLLMMDSSHWELTLPHTFCGHSMRNTNTQHKHWHRTALLFKQWLKGITQPLILKSVPCPVCWLKLYQNGGEKTRVIIIMIALQGEVRDFYNILTALWTVSQHRELSPTRTLKWPGHNRVQIMCNTSSAYHMHHVMCHEVQRDSSAIKFHRVQVTFTPALSYWLNH